MNVARTFDAGDRGHHAKRNSLSLQHRPLLYVQFEVGVQRMGARPSSAGHTCALASATTPARRGAPLIRTER